MANDRYFPRFFKCRRKKCGRTAKRYKWLSDKMPEKCECGGTMVEVIPEKVEVASYAKVASMTPPQRQAVLKARSHDHFNRVIRERKHEMIKDVVRKEKKKF